MVTITLADQSCHRFDGAISGKQLVALLKENGLTKGKDFLAMRMDDDLRDLAHIIERDCIVHLIERSSQEGLDIIRHDCAHVMAQAVQEIFPHTKIAFGPITDTGFYYDFHCAETLSTNDFPQIEKAMARIITQDRPFVRHIWSIEKAYQYFSDRQETFKAEHVLTLPKDQNISVYTQGTWLDLCRGPHAPSTGKIGDAFKLLKVSGAYWRGNAKNAQLQRIYGTCWSTKKDLRTHLHRIEEASKRDHRKIGATLDLFHFQEEALGAIFWHHKGATLYRIIEEHLRKRLRRQNYTEVKTPQLVDQTLWAQSGHWEKFRQEMFTVNDKEKRLLAIKPMNCPCHVEIFKRQNVSYKALPIRMSEFGICHRNEPSGALHGAMRVRAFTQDDAHIFCTQQQIVDETKTFCDLLLSVYQDFGFSDVRVKFSDRPKIRTGSDEIWNQAEQSLKKATAAAGLEWTDNPGEGAFYGPKLEFVLTDAIGRDWQCGTLQVDFFLPERLGATYVGVDNARHHPVMLHRAILGSLERFIGILIEHYSGRFPLWLAPQQVAVCTIVDAVIPFAQTIKAALENAHIRTTLDKRQEKISYKIRDNFAQKIPIQLIVGIREMKENTVVVRRLGAQKQNILALDAAIDTLREEAGAP